MIKVEGQTDFIGYDNLEAQATIVGLFSNGKAVDTIQSGESAVIILDQTSFYAEMGGQVGDSGLISTEICNFAGK
ncbi:alanyl-tRNA synthetase [Actinobacillus pleuropneumoniae]|nr:alanyl-tRNA synthetase [Actinobacillus pleuropneumoniae]